MAEKAPQHSEGHQARKRFGQNFLHDPHVIDQIVNSIAPHADDTMVEIGPGLGALTEQILPNVNQLQIIELDRDLIPRLMAKFCSTFDVTIKASTQTTAEPSSVPTAHRKNKLNIHQADALNFEYICLLDSPEKKLRIVGNLPYNISTPLIFKLLENTAIIQDMHFMLQKEVVDRLSANVGDKAYGRLSIMVQYHCQVDGLFVVGPGAFNPPPKVDSAIVRLTPHIQKPAIATNPKLMGKIVTAAFNMRRKTIRNGLRDIATVEQIESVGINPGQRPETIPLPQWVALSNLISS